MHGVDKVKKALLIGGTGFAGQHMGQLLSADYLVTSVGSGHDVCDREKVFSLVEKENPDVVVNMAFITTVRETFADPDKAFQIGYFGMLNLISALKNYNFKGRLLNISSSEVYGHPDYKSLPMDEFTPLRPMSPYSVTKIATEALCFQQSQTEGIDIVTARPFTHIGPGQSDRFALSSFSKQIAEILLGMRDPVIRVGSLDSTRDITDVRDVVQAYKLLLEQGSNGEVYNICSGHEVTIKSLLEKLISKSGIEIRIVQDNKLMRGCEQQRICGNYHKLKQRTGWKPKISIDQTLIDMIDSWTLNITEK
jgi:GDP-4-dehydro-6-deoxy-D-mannose reductase